MDEIDILMMEKALAQKEKEIEELKTKVTFLEEELEEIEPYRTYYQMAMRLRHGLE